MIERELYVRFGSEAGITLGPPNVRFTFKSGHQLNALGYPLSAIKRHRGMPHYVHS
jgi:hypothetical protein